MKLEGSEPLLTNPSSLPFSSGPMGLDLDMRAVSFVCPLDLVALSCWSLSLTGKRGDVLLPDPTTGSYLERMRLLERLRADGWNVPPVDTGPWDDLADRLLEVTPLRNPHDVEELADRLLKLWKGKAGDSDRTRALHFSFGELSDNAISHSEGSPVFVAAQRYSGATSPHPARLELAVGDNGIGIPAHLRRNPRYAGATEDKDAVLLALQPGVSGTPYRRGYGFHDVLRQMSEVGEGEVTVISAGVRVVAPFGNGRRRRTVRMLPADVRGTWIQVLVYE